MLTKTSTQNVAQQEVWDPIARLSRVKCQRQKWSFGSHFFWEALWKLERSSTRYSWPIWKWIGSGEGCGLNFWKWVLEALFIWKDHGMLCEKNVHASRGGHQDAQRIVHSDVTHKRQGETIDEYFVELKVGINQNQWQAWMDITIRRYLDHP